MDNSDFKKHGHEVLDWMADYFKKVESYPVKSAVRPKDIYKQIPDTAPTVFLPTIATHPFLEK